MLSPCFSISSAVSTFFCQCCPCNGTYPPNVATATVSTAIVGVRMFPLFHEESDITVTRNIGVRRPARGSQYRGRRPRIPRPPARMDLRRERRRHVGDQLPGGVID